jgi:hypothetical protein
LYVGWLWFATLATKTAICSACVRREESRRRASDLVNEWREHAIAWYDSFNRQADLWLPNGFERSLLRILTGGTSTVCRADPSIPFEGLAATVHANGFFWKSEDAIISSLVTDVITLSADGAGSLTSISVSINVTVTVGAFQNRVTKKGAGINGSSFVQCTKRRLESGVSSWDRIQMLFVFVILARKILIDGIKGVDSDG